jgi:hypothetical protein
MKRIQFLLLLFSLTLFVNAQYNYFNFTADPNLNSETCTGDGILLSPANELIYRSSYSYLCLTTAANYSNPSIIWASMVPKATSEIIYGDSKIFYVDGNDRLRQLYWGNNQWNNAELNTSSPAVNGKGLVWAGGSTIYYTATNNTIYKVYFNGTIWAFESTGAVSKTDCRICYGDNKLIYVNSSNRVSSVAKYAWGWVSGELNTASPAATGDGLVFGDNSNIYYTTTNGFIGNIYYTTSWNYGVASHVVAPITGSKLLCDHNTLYYVGADGYMYSLLWDNCDWFNKKINKIAKPKPQTIYFANNQIFYRESTNNFVYSTKTTVNTSQSTIYLKGKTFYNGTQPFYPVVMNYLVNLNTAVNLCANANAAVTDLWVSPSKDTYNWGINPSSNQTTADAYLISDLHKIKLLGCNTIRLCGASVVYNETGPPNSRIPILSSSASSYCDKIYDPINDPAFKTLLFSKIKHILDLADAEGLKVIILVGDRYPHRMDVDPTYGQAYINYGNYLFDFAYNFKNHPAILAYDLDNEPASRNIDNGKANNCSMSAFWYDQVRSADKNHLITLGLFGRLDQKSWDPNLLSVDFHSFHVYGWPWESNIDNYQDRFLAQVKWVQDNIKTPWIIGETTISAIDNSIDNANSGCLSNTDVGWNTEAQQQSYAAFSQTATRSAGGSGYSWWIFHDVAHAATNVPIEAFEGVYSLCNRAKPITAEFNKAWLNQSLYPCNNLATPNFTSTYQFEPAWAPYDYTVIGRLIDANNNMPIGGGYIRGINPNGDEMNATYSKPDGTFMFVVGGGVNNVISRVEATSLAKGFSAVYNQLPPCRNCTPWPFQGIKDIGDISLTDVGCSISSNIRKTSPVQQKIKNENVNIDVYPNPSSNHIIIHNNFENKFNVEIYDMLGKQIYSNAFEGNNENVRVDYNDLILSNNFVIIKIFDKNSSINKKVLIIK